MNKLAVPLAAITREGVSIDVVVSEAEIEPRNVDAVPVGSVSVRGALFEAGGEYLFEGVVAGHYMHPCDRCLGPADLPFSIDVLWAFKQGVALERLADIKDEDPDDQSAITCGFEGNEIDLAPRVWEEIVLAEPAKFLCREDCAGLCPRCGADLNRGPCACRDNDIMENKGLAGLVDMFPDIRPKRSEDDPRAGTKT